MKKVLLAMALVLGSTAITTESNAQAFNGAGDRKLQIGATGWGYGQGLSASFDYGVHQLFSLGVGGNFYFNNDANAFLFGRANLHLNSLLNLPKELDIYPGVNLGWRNYAASPFGWGAHLGIRYFFTPKVGIYGELGSMGSLGVSINI